jgi:hypothetical protein
VKKSFDNPVGALIGGAIEGWMGKWTIFVVAHLKMIGLSAIAVMRP